MDVLIIISRKTSIAIYWRNTACFQKYLMKKLLKIWGEISFRMWRY